METLKNYMPAIPPVYAEKIEVSVWNLLSDIRLALELLSTMEEAMQCEFNIREELERIETTALHMNALTKLVREEQ
jgi:hypothetical protein